MSSGVRTLDRNKKARHEYFIEDTLEAGIVLTGSEVKSAKDGKASLDGTYCSLDNKGEMLMHNAYIKPYKQASHFNHEPRRSRKLLMHQHELERWAEAAAQKGYTIVPLELYVRDGWIKVKIGLAKGKDVRDKRQTVKERESKRKLRDIKHEFNR
ncbi:MAG: SsrA-binding protein SmpB [Longimonas sp.]|uniref:SsrA-binding protein SmpB n=1 Tax=Longimonas sp. TaxID=2039626 RepID=UPI003975BF3B